MPAATTGATVTLQVLLFAQLRGRFGADQLSVALPTGSTGTELLAWLSQRCPAVKELLDVSRLAVNREYVARDYKLVDGDEAVVIPPVSGG